MYSQTNSSAMLTGNGNNIGQSNALENTTKTKAQHSCLQHYNNGLSCVVIETNTHTQAFKLIFTHTLTHICLEKYPFFCNSKTSILQFYTPIGFEQNNG